MSDGQAAPLTVSAVNDESLNEIDAMHVMPTYTRQPLQITKGEGVYVFAEDGERYLDFTSGIAVCALGHCHPALVEAATDQLQTLWHMSNLYLTEPQAKLAKALTTASGFDRVFFSNSGAEANEAAIKLARRYSKHKYGAHKGEIITFSHSFHGRTIATVTATAQPKYQEGFGPLPGGFRYVEAMTKEAVKAAITPKTCAIMIEPIQGEGGVRPVAEEFLRDLRQLCDEYGLLLIFDEVQTGAGRTGEWLAWQVYGIKPDIVTMAKALAGGLPIGATMADDKVASTLSAGTHGSTFGGNPVAARAAMALLEVVLTPGFLDNVKQLGAVLGMQLSGLEQAHAEIISARGMGLIWGLQLARPDAAKVVSACRERGLLVLTAGADTVRLLPPLIVNEEQIAWAVSVLNQSLEAIYLKESVTN